jgi:hypothetical protein
MTNVWGSPEKVTRRARLFEIGISVLESEGWKVERVERSGKPSLRRITKDGRSLLATIRTTQDRWIAFPRNPDDTGWGTLSEVDVVVAVSVDDADNPRFAWVHLLDGDEMRDRYDRTYAARLGAQHEIPNGRGVWLSLYHDEATSPPSLVGAGAGVVHPPIARVPLDPEEPDMDLVPEPEPAPKKGCCENRPLTIAEAKRRLAIAFGVDPSSIRITVEA